LNFYRTEHERIFDGLDESIIMEPGISEFYLMFAIATMGMLMLVIAIIFFMVFYQKKMLQEQLRRQMMEAEFQKRMLKAALDSQENERRRLAADLHDSIGAMLSTIRVGLSTLTRRTGIAEADITPTKLLLDDTIESVRAISRNLMPSTLEKFGLNQAIKEMCERINTTSSIVATFNESGTPVSLNKEKEVMLFRVVQELVNNALKHAEASEIKVDIDSTEHNLHISVADNGKGFDHPDHGGDKNGARGLDLFNIDNQSRLLAAEVKFTAPKREGTHISIDLELTEELNEVHTEAGSSV